MERKSARVKKERTRLESIPPTEILSSGIQVWKNAKGDIHRDGDLPAIINAEAGFESWFQNGLEHRDNDKPAVVRFNGAKEWYQEGKLHRNGDEPAFIHPHIKEWRKHGVLHRAGDRPAIIRTKKEYSPYEDMEWWIKGEYIRSENLDQR